jgi:hypothetical protein
MFGAIAAPVPDAVVDDDEEAHAAPPSAATMSAADSL